MSYPYTSMGDAIGLDIDEVNVNYQGEYRIAGVYGFGRGVFGRGPISGEETSYKKLHRLHANTLVMSKLKAFEGAISVVPVEFDDWFLSPEFPTFRVNEDVAAVRYIAHLCAWPEFWQRLRSESKGVGARRERVSAARLLSIDVPLPDLAEQRRVAAKLDAALGKVERIESLRVHRQRLRDAFAESSISQVIDAPDVPHVCLGDALRIERIPAGIDPAREYVQIGIRSFGKGIFHREPLLGEALSKLRYFEVHPGRLIVSNIMAWEGAIALSTEQDAGCIGSNRFLSYAPIGEVDLSYLNYFFQSERGRRLIKGTSTGTVLRNQTLSMKDFERLKVPLSDLAEQRRVAVTLDTALGRIARIESPQTQVLGALRPSLLNAAFSGQL